MIEVKICSFCGEIFGCVVDKIVDRNCIGCGAEKKLCPCINRAFLFPKIENICGCCRSDVTNQTDRRN